ncbi:General stress protein 14 [Roseibium album]|nr:General stress protein 14 [Roseibium album]
MTTTLIVLAHPSPTSFNHSWAQATEHACRSLNQTVLWSDLNSLDFDPVEKASHYSKTDLVEPYDVLKTQESASNSGALPRDIIDELVKLQQADRVVFHFPIWWFAPPAILKGWCERVLANGELHDTDNRFDTGKCSGKSALLCVTTGSKATESTFNGKEGDIQMLLWPFAYTLRYLGFSVLKPKIIHGVHGYHKGQAKSALDKRLREELSAHTDTITRFDNLPKLSFNADEDFDDQGQLRPFAPSHSFFVRHQP